MGTKGAELNPYLFVRNNAKNDIDLFGLIPGLSLPIVIELPPDQSLSFLFHYRFGNGQLYVLGSDIVSRYARASSYSIELLREQIKEKLKSDMGEKCKEEGVFIFQSSGSLTGVMRLNKPASGWQDALFDDLKILNQSTLIMNYKCTLKVACVCKNNKPCAKQITGNCDVENLIKDRFANPQDKVSPYYERDEKAYQQCIKDCSAIKRNRDAYNYCVNLCEKKYPESESFGGIAYDIAGRWQDQLPVDITSDCNF